MKICKIEGCEKKHYGIGYCKMHYERVRNYGDSSFVKTICGEDRVRHPLYATYRDMKKRCYNSRTISYKNYGAIGIKVCDEWLGLKGFSNFIADMGERPNGTTLDRIDNNKGYSKENCKWSTAHEQSANRRNNNKDVGVGFSKKENKWVASITIKKKRIRLGAFTEYQDAVVARRSAEIKYNIYTKDSLRANSNLKA